MNGLNLFGPTAVTIMMPSYALERRSVHEVLVFSVARGESSMYGLLVGTRPFGVVEAVWTVIAPRRRCV
jgi:hypothetical protein